MGQHHSSTVDQRVNWVSQLVASSGTYGLVSHLSRTNGIPRQTLYRWKAKGQAALEQALRPPSPPSGTEPGNELERAILTLLVEGHASSRGIQACLQSLLGVQVSLGTISAVVQSAGQRALSWMNKQVPKSARGLALDELYGSQRGQGYLNVVDALSGAIWASTSPVAVDGESWTLLLWQLQEQGVRWHTLVSDGGKAIEEAVTTVGQAAVHQRDVWHVLHACQQVQARLDRLVERLEQQAVTVARQAARLAAGQRPRGRKPKSDGLAHAAEMAQAQYAADGVRYVTSEMRRLLEVVVLAPSSKQGVLSSQRRQEELSICLALLEDLSPHVPSALQSDVTALLTHLRGALPQLVLFAPALDALQHHMSQQLGADAVHLLGWAWQRRAILGPSKQDLLASLPPSWRSSAGPLLQAWDEAVRASSAVENWHSIVRPFLAVHRQLSMGMLALLAVWHNHRRAPRGLHQGLCPLQRSGLTEVADDWLTVLGYRRQGTPPLAAAQANAGPLLALVA
jgi:hypothetical protein